MVGHGAALQPVLLDIHECLADGVEAHRLADAQEIYDATGGETPSGQVEMRRIATEWVPAHQVAPQEAPGDGRLGAASHDVADGAYSQSDEHEHGTD
jgi:hypothetical protein